MSKTTKATILNNGKKYFSLSAQGLTFTLWVRHFTKEIGGIFFVIFLCIFFDIEQWYKVLISICTGLTLALGVCYFTKEIGGYFVVKTQKRRY